MYGLEVKLRVSGPLDTIADHVDVVTQELAKLESCTPELLDFTVGLTVSERLVEIEMTVEADFAEDAPKVGLGCARTAIHAAGGSTPDWERSETKDSVHIYTFDSQEMRQLAVA